MHLVAGQPVVEPRQGLERPPAPEEKRAPAIAHEAAHGPGGGGH